MHDDKREALMNRKDMLDELFLFAGPIGPEGEDFWVREDRLIEWSRTLPQEDIDVIIDIILRPPCPPEAKMEFDPVFLDTDWWITIEEALEAWAERNPARFLEIIRKYGHFEQMQPYIAMILGSLRLPDGLEYLSQLTDNCTELANKTLGMLVYALSEFDQDEASMCLQRLMDCLPETQTEVRNRILQSIKEQQGK
jgi:hypothetical protein